MWEWLVLLFGLKNAPPYFERRMDQVLQRAAFYKSFIDDIIVWSSTLVEHLGHLEDVFRRLQEFGLYVHPGKRVFGVECSGRLLGHHISARIL